MHNLTNLSIPIIETAYILEDFSGNAKINIPCVMPKVPRDTKTKSFKINTNNICNSDSVFNNVKDLTLANFYEVEKVGDGFKDESLVISFVSEDINQITII